MVVDAQVDGEERRLKIEGQIDHICLGIIFGFWQRELPVAETVLFPKRDFRTYAPIGQHSLLEASYQTPTWHHAHGQLQSRHWLFTDGEDDRIVSPCRSFEDLQTLLHISRQALPSSINAIINDEYRTVATPRNLSIADASVLVLFFDSLIKCEVIVVYLGLVQDIELWREEQQLT